MVNETQTQWRKCNRCLKQKCTCFNDFAARSVSRLQAKPAATYDAFLIFLSLLLTLWMYLKSFRGLLLPTPLLITFILIKYKCFYLNDNEFVCLILKISLFLIFHYKLVVFVVSVAMLAAWLSKTIIVATIIFTIVYMIVKYWYNHMSNHSKANTYVLADVDAVADYSKNRQRHVPNLVINNLMDNVMNSEVDDEDENNNNEWNNDSGALIDQKNFRRRKHF